MSNNIEYLHHAWLIACPLLFLALQACVACVVAGIICMCLLSNYFDDDPDWSALLFEVLRGTERVLKEYVLRGLLVLCLVAFCSAWLQLLRNILRLMAGWVVGAT